MEDEAFILVNGALLAEGLRIVLESFSAHLGGEFW